MHFFNSRSANSWDPSPVLTLKKWVGAIHQLHTQALKGVLGGLHIQQVQDNRLVSAKHGSGGHLRSQRIANLTCKCKL